MIVRKLLKLAQDLDEKGLEKEADKLDKIAQDISDLLRDEASSDSTGLDEDDISALMEASGSSRGDIEDLLSQLNSN